MPLPIPGSTITSLRLTDYLGIESHPPDRLLTFENIGYSSINGIDDLTASMVIAHNATAHQPRDDTEIGYVPRLYNPGMDIPFRSYIYAPRAPADHRHYKSQTFAPVVLAQREGDGRHLAFQPPQPRGRGYGRAIAHVSPPNVATDVCNDCTEVPLN